MLRFFISHRHIPVLLLLLSLQGVVISPAEAQFKKEHSGYLILRDVAAEAAANDGKKRYSEKYRIRQIDSFAEDKIIIRAQDKRGVEKLCELPLSQLGVRRPMKSQQGKLCPDGVRPPVDPHLSIMLLVFEDLPGYLNYEITCDVAQGGEVIGYSLLAVPCPRSRITDCPDQVPRELFRHSLAFNKDSYPLPPESQESLLDKFADNLGRILLYVAKGLPPQSF